MAETWSGEIYCVKCKKKQPAPEATVIVADGRKRAQAACPVCGTNRNVMLGRG